MSARRFVYALVAVFGLPALASAGPIEFRYTASGSVSLYPGQRMPGDVWFSFTPETNLRAAAPGGPVELGAVTFGPSPGPQANDSYSAYTPFVVSVTVTDGMERSATLALAGGAVDEWDYRSWDGRWLNTSHRLDLGDSYHGNASETSAVIGDARYTLTVRPENDGQVGIYALTATSLTPEPGALALAALGFASLGLRSGAAGSCKLQLMPRVAGCDPGTSSLDILALEDGRVVAQVRIESDDLRADPTLPVRWLRDEGPFDLIAGPSGYGLPLVRAADCTDAQLGLMSLVRPDERAAKGVGGFSAMLRRFGTARCRSCSYRA